MKMHKITIGLIFLLAISIASIVYAETSNISPVKKSDISSTTKAALQHRPGMKAERGMKNILFGWTEIPKSIIQVTKDSKNPLWGITGGTLKGFGKAFPRTISGVADVVSFPIGDYDKMPIKPDELKTKVK